MARFIGDDGPDVPDDNPAASLPSAKPAGPRPHPAARGVHGLDYLGTTDAARWLGVHRNTLLHMCDEGTAPPHQRVGKRRDRKFRVTDLEQFLKAQTEAEAARRAAGL